MWKDSYKVVILERDKRLIDVKVSYGSMVFFLTCVYGDPVTARRKEVWNRLEDIGLLRDEAWMLAGDFNELMSNEEKSGGAIRSESSFWDFRNMAQNCKLQEIRFSGNCLSWGGWREKVWVQCRLDRSFGNSEWFSLFPRVKIEYLDMFGSDHRPIRICFAHEAFGSHSSRFFFDKRMMKRKGFEEIVKQSWGVDSTDTSNTMARIIRCKRRIKRWKRQTDLNSRERISRLKTLLEKEVSKSHPSYQVMKRLKQDLASAYREEEIYWRQKCREEWLRSGDRNTKFFQNCVKGKRMQNRILMLLDEWGQEHFSEGSKGNIAVDFFCDLFQSSDRFDLETLFTGFSSRVTDDMNIKLTAPVLAEEIRAAAFSVKGSSAPGEDGLTGAFYQKYWHIIGPGLIREIQQFFQSSVMPEGWNHTLISLLLKVTKPTQMRDMRQSAFALFSTKSYPKYCVIV